MSVEGSAAVSAGYRYNLAPSVEASFESLAFQISGNAAAQYYINIFNQDGKLIVKSGWIDSPSEEKEVSLAIPNGGKVGAVEFYVQSKSGARRRTAFARSPSKARSAAGHCRRRAGRGRRVRRLDLRRAVATVNAAAVRTLADRNVFLIETDKEIFLEEIKAKELPAAEQGLSNGVKWLQMKMPGDVDYAGMEYAMAVASSGKQKAVSLVTSRDTRKDVREEAIRLAQETVAANPATLIAQHEAEWRDSGRPAASNWAIPISNSGGIAWRIFCAVSRSRA